MLALKSFFRLKRQIYNMIIWRGLGTKKRWKSTKPFQIHFSQTEIRLRMFQDVNDGNTCIFLPSNTEWTAELNIHPSLHHSLSGSGFQATMSETDVQRTVRSMSRGSRRLQSDNTQPSLLLWEQEAPQWASSKSIAETLTPAVWCVKCFHINTQLIIYKVMILLSLKLYNFTYPNRICFPPCCVCAVATARYLIKHELEREKNQCDYGSKVPYNVTCENIAHVVLLQTYSYF